MPESLPTSSKGWLESDFAVWGLGVEGTESFLEPESREGDSPTYRDDNKLYSNVYVLSIR